MARKTFAELLEQRRVLIFNSRKPEIATLLQSYGIDSTHLENGVNLYNSVITATENQRREQQEEGLAYDNLYVSKDDFATRYKKTLKISRMASRSDANLQNRLKVNAPAERTIEGWILQVVDFYNRLNNEPDFITVLNKYGITSETLSQEKQIAENLRILRNEAMSEKGQAQEATRVRDVEIEKLDDYCYELKTIAKIALENKPQLLEELGILVR